MTTIAVRSILDVEQAMVALLDSVVWPHVATGARLDDGPCWLWQHQLRTASIDGPSVRVGRRAYKVRSLLYAYANPGTSPDIKLDVRCHMVRCVRPSHAVVRIVRQRRDVSTVRAVKTHCKYGHDLSVYRKVTAGGYVRCRQCHQDRETARRRIRSAERIS